MEAKLAEVQALRQRLYQLRSKRLSAYRADPVAWVHDMIDWREDEAGPSNYQEEILSNLVTYRKEAARGPHGLGKTTDEAWAVLWFATTRDGEDWKVVTTATSWYQLTHYLWPEIHKWARRLNWAKLGREPFKSGTELLQLSLKLDTGEAFAVASSDHQRIEGAHGDHLLYVFDEAKAIPAATWDAAEGAFSTAQTDDLLALACSTPGTPSGRFYSIHKREPGFEDWHVRHVTRDEAISEGRISEAWCEQRRRQWGESSFIYQNRVLGEFAAGDEDSVIPLAWVEAAQERWCAFAERLLKRRVTKADWPNHEDHPPQQVDIGEALMKAIGKLDAIGGDIANGGGDVTSLAPRRDNVIVTLRRHAYGNTMQAAGHIRALIRGHGGRAVVDAIGVGAGVSQRLQEQNVDVDGFVASAKGIGRDRSGEWQFLNRRARAWWRMREMLDPINNEDVCLPPDDRLTGDLTAPKWEEVSGGKIKVEAKDDVRERLGRSTDDGDAVVMVFDSPGSIGYAYHMTECPNCSTMTLTPPWQKKADGTPWGLCPGCGHEVLERKLTGPHTNGVKPDVKQGDGVADDTESDTDATQPEENPWLAVYNPGMRKKEKR